MNINSLSNIMNFMCSLCDTGYNDKNELAKHKRIAHQFKVSLKHQNGNSNH